VPDKETAKQTEIKQKGILDFLIHEIASEFISDSGSSLKEIKVTDVRIGLAYTGVLLSEKYGGVACTPLYEFSGCPAFGFQETLKGSSADKLLKLSFSKNPLEAAVGIATANALSHMLLELKPEKPPVSNIDILDLINPGDKIGMIGYFAPLVPKILEITDKLTILEKRDVEAEAAEIKILPSERAAKILPNSDVIIISASTLANQTFDELLALRGKAREVVLLGPSTPLYPKPFFEQGVTAVMGTKIFNPITMLTIVSEAGGTKKLHQYCGEKIAFRIN
jgi:uncharacterized protein (DUF4213/DUF364 family)